MIMYQDCDTSVAQVTLALKSAGFYVQQSFNLRTVTESSGVCLSDQTSCLCQIVILLVYAQEGSPATLVFDGKPSQTVLSLVTGPAQPAATGLIGKLAQLLPGTFFPLGSLPK